MPNHFCQRKARIKNSFHGWGGWRYISHQMTSFLHIVGNRTWKGETNCIVYYSFSVQVLEMFLGSRDHSNRGSREGSMGPLSRQSSNASVSSITSLQDAGCSGSQFFEVEFCAGNFLTMMISYLFNDSHTVGSVSGQNQISVSPQSTTNIYWWCAWKIPCSQWAGRAKRPANEPACAYQQFIPSDGQISQTDQYEWHLRWKSWHLRSPSCVCQ